MEWNPAADKFSPLANWLVLEETERRPAVIAGTSSDRIGTPTGQSFYATASKNLERLTGLPIAPYGGLTYGTYEEKLRPIGGVNWEFTDRLSALIIFDGVHLHEMLSYSRGRHTFSVLLIRSNDPGVSYGVGF